MDKNASLLLRFALAVALVQACSEGNPSTPPVDEDVPGDVSTTDDVETPADTSAKDVATNDAPTDATLDTAPTDATLDTAPTDATLDTAPTDATLDTAPTDATLDTAPADATLDVVSADVSLDVRPADVTTDVAPIDVTLDVSPVDAAVDVRPADAATDVVSTDVARDVPSDGPVTPAGGFSAAGTWPVPASGLSDGFYASSVATGTRWWALLDMDGDHLPDLVQTGDPARSGGYVFGAGTATPYWKVFRNTGAGFALTAINWPVPDIGLSDGPYVTFSATGTRWWSTIDIDGDGRPDLVQTGDPARTGGYVFGAGTATPSWRVFRNTGSGFATTATTWRVPDIGLGDGPYSTSVAEGVRWWSTIDIDGDQRPDLVQTGDPARTGGYVFGAGTATPSWRVFRNMGSGFATVATPWATPDIGLGDGPYVTFSATGVRWWSTIDMDGDQRPDLVQTGDPARTGGYVFGAGTATPSWKLFRNTGSGFASTATTWATPDIGLGDGPYSTSSATGVRWWSTLDVDGDRRPDLVQTGDPARTGGYVFGAGTATPYWKVFSNSGSGFARAATSWSTPDIGLGDGPYATFSATGVRWWSTLDMNGDGRIDLAQTGDPARTGGYVFAGVGAAPGSWRVFLGR